MVKKSFNVKHIAKLATLNMTASEIDKFAKQLSLVLDYMDQLKEVDTSNTLPTNQTTGLKNVTSPDNVRPCQKLTQKEALSGSKNIKEGYFVVSKSETIGEQT